MDKPAAVRALAAAGVLVSPDVLAQASAEQLEQLLRGPKQLFVTALAPVAAVQAEPEPAAAAQLAVSDFAEAYQRKFERLRDLLLRRPELAGAVSLAGARAAREAACIGMVQRQLPEGVVLEDPTGTLEVALSGERPERDDVVAVRGEMRGSVLEAKELLFPDVPLPKQVPHLPGELVLGGPGPLSFTPTRFPAAARVGPLRVVAWQPPAPLDKKAAVAILQRRWLPLAPSPGAVEPALLDPAPDVLWLSQERAWSETYKGVTIVAAPSAAVDLSTRSVRIGPARGSV